jgi:hypothetical protein
MAVFVNYRNIARDALLLWGTTFVVGLVIGTLYGPGSYLRPVVMRSIGLLNCLIGIAAFCMSGYLCRTRRWKHLFAVALLFWMLSAVGLLSQRVTLRSWAFSGVAILCLMGAGGALSLLISRQRSNRPIGDGRVLSGTGRE